MKKIDILEKAKSQDRTALTEAESKEVLRQYGIPVVEEKVVNTIEEAKTAAKVTGYPVVLKGLGSRLTHKTEKGLVKLNLKNEEELHSAAIYIKEAAGNDLEGFLIQPMLEGKREFVAGLFRDEQFGATVMFGLGGIFTEAIGDVVFRLAPFDGNEAQKMIDELHAQKLLGAFRGENAPDKDALIKTLVGLSRIGTEIPDIKEIDINPLLVSADGKITAVDALIVLGNGKDKKEYPLQVDLKHVWKLFYPKSIAFVGASANISKWGHLMFSGVVAGKYQGEIYLVNSQGGEIAGRKVFKSVTAIPDPVDLAVVTVPADKVLSLIPELEKKEIKNVLLISSGFGEVGAEGKLLEAELVKKAREAGILIIGPNTMGICNPCISFYCVGSHVRPPAGGTVLLAQSGNLGTQLLAFAAKEDVGIRAFCGSGNEAMITIEDYMEGFEVDEKTKTVVLYLESIKNGRRFFESAKRVGKIKPIIVLKGGRTTAGSHAAASHTGAMASDIKVFMAACRQAGIIQAESPTDLLDLSAAFSSLPLPKGNKVGLLTLGGGWGVVASDLCEENGLTVPKLSEAVISQINKLLPPFWSHANPIDVVGEMNADTYMKILEELIQWSDCDAIIHMGIIGRKIMIKAIMESTVAVDNKYDSKFVENSLLYIDSFEKQTIEQTVKLMEKYNKPIIGVYLLNDEQTQTVTDVNGCKHKGVNFITPERAVKSLAKMYQYSKWLNG
ncbi:MAG: CoA-binding protein [Deltaproteobacteria bacterium HGW-Deltaproteobacteria-13]|jgi:acyl-CoA synthetase (NDP forming)|nr:MAG: CoA-binding protein [Deltaproteobacteria bacterium HGW-Deltaproteobacteria-13]